MSARKAVLFSALIAALCLLSTLSWIQYFSFIVAVTVAFIGYNYILVVLLTLPRDALSLFRFLNVKLFMYGLKSRNTTVPQIFQENVKKHPNRVMFYHESRNWTFKEVDEFSNQVANCFLELGFHPGEEVALLMESRPEFVAIWLGFAKIGVVAALINTQQRLDSLVHSITVVNCKAIVYESAFNKNIKDVVSDINRIRPLQYFCYGEYDPTELPARPLHNLLAESSTDTPSQIRKGNFTDRLFYIYTSGTTGLPKAAIIKHCRYIWMGSALKFMIGLRSDEVIYTAIPLYHLAGGVLGSCQCVIFGSSMAIRPKFSASKFWDDCIKYKCTAAQYIGEICRYLLSQPQSPADQTHSVRIVFGNGLRPSIWKQFKERFRVESVGEFYGSTEGNANIVNTNSKEGACGFISQILPWIYPVTLIKIDENTSDPVRDENGMCVRCKPGECGEFVGKILNNDPERAFDGYANKEANAKKIVHDVFEKGDQAFLSGDLLEMDTFGYLYFKDRTGDTFRWKGENVSTTEVEAVISNTIHLSDSVVFGVSVPGCEGKAGMAVIADPQRSVDLNNFFKKLQERLPQIAIPVFVRLVNRIDATSTYKLSKSKYQREGFKPSEIKDPVYYLNSKSKTYSLVDDKIFKQIESGEIRL
ncbi:Long-chain fatty acid transport protein 1-like protein [Leptotrombidium deliense]|uniref:long-chain-fatty-acid--CoA ligase n=1 Tax=Leptotrombidium deliense TaxID=299467 RepID=A0A443SCR7_9ACAR|nr:Long-chain fatty acid transport protein 1-like protein [Leptotrombidium deliense]